MKNECENGYSGGHQRTATMNMTTMTAKSLSLCKLDEGCRKRANPLNSPILNKFSVRARDARETRARIECKNITAQLSVVGYFILEDLPSVIPFFFCSTTFSMIIILRSKKFST